jgi:hypothetical protein
VSEVQAAPWYTKARKIPQLIGKLPDGTTIPGGPYTASQVATAAIVAVALWKTTWLWARFDGLVNVVVAVGVLVGSVLLARGLPDTGRNPATWAIDMVALLTGDGRTKITIPRQIWVWTRCPSITPVPDGAAHLDVPSRPRSDRVPLIKKLTPATAADVRVGLPSAPAIPAVPMTSTTRGARIVTRPAPRGSGVAALLANHTKD